MQRVPGFLSLLILFALSGAGARAVTLQQLSMDEMTENATSIVRAKVTGANAAFTGTTIYTHYRLQVSESWKGFAPVEVMVPGGVVNRSKQSYPGVPELSAGAEYVLFLWTSPSTGITHLLGMQQGVFSVAGPDDASLLATRAHIGEMMLDRGGRRVADEQVQMKLTDLRSKVSRATTALSKAAVGAVQ